MRRLALYATLGLGAVTAVACIGYPLGHWFFYRSLTADLSLLLLTGVLIAGACYRYQPSSNSATRVLFLVISISVLLVRTFFVYLHIAFRNGYYI